MLAIVWRYLRMAPLYYMIFIYGWLITSRLEPDSPWWYTFEMGFENCSNYYWSVFTMTINEIPHFMVANEGCYFWGWVVACEMQLILVLPFLIRGLEAIGDKTMARKITGDLICLVLMGFGMFVSFELIF